ncbi:MAG: glycosyl transferase [Hyphomonadaceae bacterium]|nr:MAG: glycosyl transferase [Hyphomonadaceae bacterium]
MTIEISVIILTFHRAQGALNSVRSVLNQKNAPKFEIILMDNDRNASAKLSADILAAEAEAKQIDFTYAIEPEAGVANARNSAVKLAKGTFIAFLDDDEVAFENWLEMLVAAQKETEAEVVFGPIEARLEQGYQEPHDFFKLFFSRLVSGPTRIIEKPYGCGNCLLSVAATQELKPPFNPMTNDTGGEDDLLWAYIASKGGKFGWAENAWVYEDVPSNRANWRYLTLRGFAYGHNTTAQYFDAATPNYVAGVASMAKGVVQALVMAPIALALWILRHPQRAWAYDKMLRGLGKVFWGGPFKVKLYGEKAKKAA